MGGGRRGESIRRKLSRKRLRQVGQEDRIKVIIIKAEKSKN